MPARVFDGVAAGVVTSMLSFISFWMQRYSANTAMIARQTACRIHHEARLSIYRKHRNKSQQSNIETFSLWKGKERKTRRMGWCKTVDTQEVTKVSAKQTEAYR